MLDVHPPHQPAHGWREVLLHLAIITVGLLIALSLEGLVEWRHHRHLVHVAEASLHREIAANEREISGTLKDLESKRQDLDNDITILKQVMRTGKMPQNASMNVSAGIQELDSVSFKTAQSTGAMGYMTYDEAQRYAEIYGTQAVLSETEKQAARDAIMALAPFVNLQNGDPDPTPAQAAEMEGKIAVLQGQLALVKSIMLHLEQEYKTFLAESPQ